MSINFKPLLSTTVTLLLCTASYAAPSNTALNALADAELRKLSKIVEDEGITATLNSMDKNIIDSQNISRRQSFVHKKDGYIYTYTFDTLTQLLTVRVRQEGKSEEGMALAEFPKMPEKTSDLIEPELAPAPKTPEPLSVSNTAEPETTVPDSEISSHLQKVNQYVGARLLHSKYDSRYFVVDSVEDGTNAHKAGLRKYDLLLNVGGMRAIGASDRQLANFLRRLSGRKVKIEFRRGKTYKTTWLRLN